MGHGTGAIVQRRGRYEHAHTREFLLLLDVPVAFGMGAGATHRARPDWRVHGDSDCRVYAGGRLIYAFPARDLEICESLSASSQESIPCPVFADTSKTRMPGRTA